MYISCLKSNFIKDEIEKGKQLIKELELPEVAQQPEPPIWLVKLGNDILPRATEL